MQKTVLVLYGGVSTEHEVSIVSALQVMNSLKEAEFKVVAGYVSKEGEWYIGNDKFLEPEFYKDLERVKRSGKLMVLPANRNLGLLKKGLWGLSGEGEQIDVVFPVFHGRNGEDGTIQGLLELMNLPFVGCGVLGSSVGMDKFIAKRVAETVGLNVTDDVLIAKCEWEMRTKKMRERLKKVKMPVFVKPVAMGSSIGITRVDKIEDLENILEVAFLYDQRVMIEEAIDSPKEVNISIMGNGPYEVSVTEQPVSSGELLSFEDKYLREGGAKGSKSRGMASLSRIMPAPVGEKVIKKIEESVVKFFGAIGGKGIARVDFMIDKNGKLFFNEINTMPGSLSFYLWEKSGISFKKLVTKLVNLAIEDWKDKNKLITTFESNILSGFARKSIKGGKV